MNHGGARPGAGRPKRSPNRRTLELRALLEDRFPGWDPVVQLAAAANDESLPMELRLQMAEKVAPYRHAKRKALEVDARIDRLPVIHMDLTGFKGAEEIEPDERELLEAREVDTDGID